MRWPSPKPCLLGVTARPSVSPSSPAKSPSPRTAPPAPLQNPATLSRQDLRAGLRLGGPGRGERAFPSRALDLPVRRGSRHPRAHCQSCGRWALAPGPVTGTQQSLHKHHHVSFLQHTVMGCLLCANHRVGCWGPKTVVCVCVVVSTQVPRSDSLICHTVPAPRSVGGGAGVCDSYRTLAVTVNPQGPPGGVPSAMGHRSGGRVLVPGYRLPLRPSRPARSKTGGPMPLPGLSYLIQERERSSFPEAHGQ